MSAADSSHQRPPEPPPEWSGFEVAIIGMAGRFPGAGDVEQLWSNLRAGVESISVLTDEELLAAGESASALEDPAYVRAAAILEGIDQFDAGFFGITPREAELTDPQQRLFLEHAWVSLENAGYDPDRCPGPVGVFGGMSHNGYMIRNLLTCGTVETGSLPVLFGNGNDFLSTRVSYKLGLSGPSFDVQTSCSSSLVAVHLACQSLLAGECDLALAGGVGIVVPHGLGYIHQEQGIYSPDGHCRAFSSRAQGTVGGSGVAMVTLRRLSDAIEAGDNILAVIKGSAINNDGADKVGYAAPSVGGQTQVVQNALAMAEVHPDTIGYIESHGTGTALGDPIEIAALTAAFRGQTDRTGYCAIGSIKTNMGHLDAAAGVTGLIKASLAVRHAELPPSLNCEEPDPKIDFPSTPFRVQTELSPWEGDGPRRAGVSSFGIGGTNVHVIVEEPPPPAESAPAPGQHLVVLSARNHSALDEACANLRTHLQADAGLNLADVAWTLQMGRKDLPVRRTLRGATVDELCERLEAHSGPGVRDLTENAPQRPAVFLFPGQGAQYVNMGRELFEQVPAFAEHVNRACDLFQPHLGLDLRTLLYPAAGGEDEATEQLKQTWLTQPALFVIEYALARLWMHWGVQPQAMIGHSIGEYVAAALSDVFTFEDAVALVAARGRLMQDMPAGDMLAIPLPEVEVEPLLGDELSLAAVNEPSSCVASGPAEPIARLAAELKERGVATRELHTSHAFHSAMMDPILEEFTDRVRATAPKAPTLPFVSTLTGTWITAQEATDPSYWARHMRRTVRFAAGMDTLLGEPQRVMLEVGPGNTLSTLGTRIARRREEDVPAGSSKPVFQPSMRHPRETLSDSECLHDALGQLWLARVPIDWSAYHGGAFRRRLPLPCYPFQRKRYWIEPGEGGVVPVDAGKKEDIANWFYQTSWRRMPTTLGAAPDLQAQRVLLFTDGSDLAGSLIELLQGQGKDVTPVTVGGAFAASDGGGFTLRPGEPADYDALAKALGDQDRRPEAVLHLWSLHGECTDPTQGLDRGFLSVLFLTQALAADSSLAVTVVTRGTADVLGDEPILPHLATLVGLARSITQECANTSCRVIDWASNEGAAHLLAEIAREPDQQRVVCRGSHRWSRWYEPVSVSAEESPSFRSGLHTLVIGGLGSVGLEVAGCLAAAGDARLTLIGRSAFPERTEWNRWLESHDDGDETSHCILLLRALETRGAQVLTLSADVGDSGQMAAALQTAEARFGPLNGVVHAAGAEKNMMLLRDTTREVIEAQFQPKVAGLEALEQLLAGRELDFCFIQSSLASCMGVFGMVGYVAAHDYVDAFVARHNQGSDTPWISANWDHWLTWKEPEFLHDHGGEAYYMTPEEGSEAFRRVLAMPAGTQIVVSTGDLQTRIAQWSGTLVDGGEGGSDSLHERPELASDYQAPTTDAERALVAAWGEVLGIGEIGIEDNFFELGGDSVLGLQIVAKVAKQGFKIAPAQIFEHPTISGLAGVAESTQGSEVDQGAVTGSLPLLPIQHWFFEQAIPTPDHFNLPMLFQLGQGTRAEHVGQALADVVEHHDGLRVRFAASADGVSATHDPEATGCALDVVDLSAVTGTEREAAVAARTEALHLSLNMEKGPIMGAVLFLLGDDEAPELLWVMHHLVVDVVSWRILLEDFQTALGQRSRGDALDLPPKTTSLKAWADGLEGHAASETLAAELGHWRGLAEAAPQELGADKSTGDNVHSSSRTLHRNLDEDTTRALLQDVPGVYGTRIDEVLLTALVLGTERARGMNRLLVDLEGHGREDVTGSADLSRTVGWLTTLYPALVSSEGCAGPGEALKVVKEQVRGIPQHGIGFGVLRYMSPDAGVRDALAAIPAREVNFLYLGQFDAQEESSDSTRMRILEERSGVPCSPDVPRAHLIEVVAFVREHRLRLELSYSVNRHEEATAQALLDGIASALEELIQHCQGPGAGGHTPSDFPGAKVSQASLDKLLSKIGRAKGGQG